MMIHEITALVEPYPDRKRVGRGRGTGHGKTSGRGTKGAHSRSGWSRKMAREGGQLPYFRRIPKRGFSNVVFADVFNVINVSDLDRFFNNGETVDAAALGRFGLMRDESLPVKILGNGELGKSLTVVCAKISASAREKVEKAGGSVQIVERKTWTRPEKPKADKGKGAKK